MEKEGKTSSMFIVVVVVVVVVIVVVIVVVVVVDNGVLLSRNKLCSLPLFQEVNQGNRNEPLRAWREHDGNHPGLQDQLHQVRYIL